MPPPSLLATTTVSPMPRAGKSGVRPGHGRRPSRREHHRRAAVATATPSADEMVPSMPLTPRLDSTRIRAACPGAKASTSRTGMLEATTRRAPSGRADTTRRRQLRLAEGPRGGEGLGQQDVSTAVGGEESFCPGGTARGSACSQRLGHAGEVPGQDEARPGGQHPRTVVLRAGATLSAPQLVQPLAEALGRQATAHLQQQFRPQCLPQRFAAQQQVGMAHHREAWMPAHVGGCVRHHRVTMGSRHLQHCGGCSVPGSARTHHHQALFRAGKTAPQPIQHLLRRPAHGRRPGKEGPFAALQGHELPPKHRALGASGSAERAHPRARVRAAPSGRWPPRGR